MKRIFQQSIGNQSAVKTQVGQVIFVAPNWFLVNCFAESFSFICNTFWKKILAQIYRIMKFNICYLLTLVNTLVDLTNFTKWLISIIVFSGTKKIFI